MNSPPRYATLRALLPSGEVSFGCGGFHLFEESEIERGQVGYSVASDGTSLWGRQGDWRPDWFVIGYEMACGDPLFVGVDDPALPVFTAIHGEGRWKPVAISISLDAFWAALKEVTRISVGRSNPVELDANPPSDGERREFLTRISELNTGQIGMDFWEILLDG